MNILFLVRALDIGGSQRQLSLLASGLARRGHAVTVAVLYAGGALEAAPGRNGVRIISLGKTGRWDAVGPVIRLWRLLRREPADVLYAFLPTQTTLSAVLLPPRLRARLVFGVRSGTMDLTSYDWLSAFVYRLEA